MSDKLKIALVMAAVAVSACAQQEEPAEVMIVEEEPTGKF